MRVLLAALPAIAIVVSCIPTPGPPDAGPGDAGQEDAGLVVAEEDLDDNGIADALECRDFDPEVCDIRCPICIPGTLFPCPENESCQANEDRSSCLADEDLGLLPATLSAEQLNVVATALQAPLEFPAACPSGGYLWTAVVNYFGPDVAVLRVAFGGNIVFLGPPRPAVAQGPIRFGRSVEADVCLPLRSDDPNVPDLRMAAQLVTEAGEISMTKCGRLFATLERD